jgi:hypothetical protein
MRRMEAVRTDPQNGKVLRVERSGFFEILYVKLLRAAGGCLGIDRRRRTR